MSRETQEYVCDYYHDGSRWSLNIHAYDFADAEARVAKLGNLQLRGELMLTIRATPATGLLVRVCCAVRNWWQQNIKAVPTPARHTANTQPVESL